MTVLTQRWRAALLVVAVVASGVATGIASAQLGDDPPQVLDTLPVPPDTRAYRDPLPDLGAVGDVAAVKSDVVSQLKRARAIMAPATIPVDLRSQLGEVYATAVLDKMVMETQRAMSEAAADPEYKPYDQHDLTVTDWQGVQVTSPASATAMFLAYESWRDTGTTTWQQDQILQYQVVLAKEGNIWKLADEAAFNPDERPAVDPAETPANGYPRMP